MLLAHDWRDVQTALLMSDLLQKSLGKKDTHAYPGLMSNPSWRATLFFPDLLTLQCEMEIVPRRCLTAAFLIPVFKHEEIVRHGQCHAAL